MRIQYKIGLIVGVCALVVGFFFCCKQTTDFVNFPIQKSGPVIIFGDSLVEGVGSLETGGFSIPLGDELGIELMNRGKRGDTTEDSLGRLEGDVLVHEPRVVFVLLGGNDFLKRVPPETIFLNLRLIISKIQSSGSFVVLMGVQSSLLLDRYEDEYKKLAKETGCLYVPNVLEGVYGESELMFDAIHPNKHGYQMITEKILFTLNDWDISFD